MEWTIDVALRGKPDDLLRALKQVSSQSRELSRTEADLQRIDRRLAVMGKNKPTVTVAVDDSQVGGAEKSILSLGKKSADVLVSVDDSEITDAAKRVDGLDAESTDVVVHADDSEVLAAAKRVEQLDGQSVTVQVHADSAGIDFGSFGGGNIDLSNRVKMPDLGGALGQVEGLTDSLGGMSSGMGGISAAAGPMGAVLTAALGAAAVQAKITQIGIEGIIDATMLAADESEALSASVEIFGRKGAKAVEVWAEDAPQALGMTTTAALQAVNGLSGMLITAGFAREESAALSKQLVTTATDLGSLWNVDSAEAQAAIAAGFRGEYEQLEKLNIFLNETKVAQKAVEMGLATSTAAVDDHAKAQARLALIQEQSAVASGNFGDTLAMSLPNQMKVAQASFTQLVTEFGKPFLGPALAAISKFSTEALPALQPFLDKLGPKLAKAFEATTVKVVDLAKNSGPFIEALGDMVETGIEVIGVLADIASFVSDVDQAMSLITGGAGLFDSLVPGGGLGEDLERIADNFTSIGETSAAAFDALAEAGEVGMKTMADLSQSQRDYADALMAAGVMEDEAIGRASTLTEAQAAQIAALQQAQTVLADHAKSQQLAAASTDLFRLASADGAITASDLTAVMAMTGATAEEVGQAILAGGDNVRAGIDAMAQSVPSMGEAFSSLQMTVDNFDVDKLLEELHKITEAQIEATDNASALMSQGMDALVSQGFSLPTEMQGIFFKQLLEMPAEELAAKEAQLDADALALGTSWAGAVNSGVAANMNVVNPVATQTAEAATHLDALGNIRVDPEVGLIDNATGPIADVQSRITAIPDRHASINAIDHASQAAYNATNAINGIPDRTVYVNVVVSGAQNLVDSAYGALGFAHGGVRYFANGGLLDTGGVTTSQITVFGEPETGAEMFLPKNGISKDRAFGLLETGASWYGLSIGGQGVNTSNVSAPVALNVTVDGGGDVVHTVRREVMRVVQGPEMAAAIRRSVG